MSGVCWEQHCTSQLLKAGFEPFPGWECCFLHRQLRLVLSVYVDDFKLAGPASNLDKGWALIQANLKMDPPTPVGKYLGCSHEFFTLTAHEVTERQKAITPILQWAESAEEHYRRNGSMPCSARNCEVLGARREVVHDASLAAATDKTSTRPTNPSNTGTTWS